MIVCCCSKPLWSANALYWNFTLPHYTKWASPVWIPQGDIIGMRFTSWAYLTGALDNWDTPPPPLILYETLCTRIYRLIGYLILAAMQIKMHVAIYRSFITKRLSCTDKRRWQKNHTLWVPKMDQTSTHPYKKESSPPPLTPLPHLHKKTHT